MPVEFDASKRALSIITKCYFSKIYYTKEFSYYRIHPSRLLFFKRNISVLTAKIRKQTLKNIYIFNDISPITQAIVHKLEYSGKVILVEEGIGLYRNTKKRSNFVFTHFGKLLFGNYFINTSRIGESEFVNTILCRFPNKLTEKQKEKNIKKMNNISFKTLAKNVGINQIVGKTWFIGQPLVEDGVLSEERYLRIIKLLSEVQKIIIKPHPRENWEKYQKINCKIIKESEIPIELLICNDNITNVFTFFSSAVISLSYLNNIQTYALYKLEAMDNIVSENIESIFKDNNVRVVEQFEELELRE